MSILGVGTSWLIAICVLGYISALITDAVATWRGVYQVGTLGLIILTFIHPIVATLAARALGISYEGATLVGLGALFFVGTFVAFERMFDTARGLLIAFRGLRPSGNQNEAMVVAVVPSGVRDGFADEFLEERIEKESGNALRGTSEPVKARRPGLKLDFRLAKVSKGISESEILYRVREGIVEVLCMPEDGIVVRFEEGKKAAQELNFVLRHLYHFQQPDDQQLTRSQEQVRNAFQSLAKPLLAVRARTVVGYVMAVFLICILVAATLNLNQILNWLPGAGPTLGAIASIIVIVGAFYVGLRRIGQWYRSERKL